MTKEAILFKTLSANVDKVSNEGAVHTDVVLEAMEDYAKQEAIEFAEWLVNSNYEKSAYNGLYYLKNQVIYKSIQYTLGQLYELYIKGENGK